MLYVVVMADTGGGSGGLTGQPRQPTTEIHSSTSEKGSAGTLRRSLISIKEKTFEGIFFALTQILLT